MIFELFSKEYLARDLKRANLITSGIGDRTWRSNSNVE
jgi:hypothetical protein